MHEFTSAGFRINIISPPRGSGPNERLQMMNSDVVSTFKAELCLNPSSKIDAPLPE